MKKFFQSGAAFMVVALLCLAAGVTAENGTVFFAIGGFIAGFWVVMAAIVRGKNAKKPAEDE